MILGAVLFITWMAGYESGWWSCLEGGGPSCGWLGER